MTTPLHRALGITNQELTWSHLEQICDHEAREQTDLDFKKTIPFEKNKLWKDEFAKDLAAMANTDGGVLVIGIGEKNGAANEIVPFDLSDTREQEFMSVAFSKLSPPLIDISIERVHNPEDTAQSVVLVNIAQSIDAPHLIVTPNENRFKVPYRHGARTEYLDERRIADLYQKRFEGMRNRKQSLEQLFDEQAEIADEPGTTWIVLAAQPQHPVHSASNIPDASGQEMIGNAKLFRDRHSGGFPGLTDAYINTSTLGFRRRTWTSPAKASHHAQEISIHNDGSVSAALRISTPDDIPGHINVSSAEQAIVDFTGLLKAAADEFLIIGGYFAQIGVQVNHTERILPMRHNSMRKLTEEGNGVRKARRVLCEMHTNDEASLVKDMYSLSTDFVNSMGLASPRIAHSPKSL